MDLHVIAACPEGQQAFDSLSVQVELDVLPGAHGTARSRRGNCSMNDDMSYATSRGTGPGRSRRARTRRLKPGPSVRTQPSRRLRSCQRSRAPRSAGAAHPARARRTRCENSSLRSDDGVCGLDETIVAGNDSHCVSRHDRPIRHDHLAQAVGEANGARSSTVDVDAPQELSCGIVVEPLPLLIPGTPRTCRPPRSEASSASSVGPTAGRPAASLLDSGHSGLRRAHSSAATASVCPRSRCS